ncbi:hypothetical protein B9G53_05245 [Pseudanabaena sp. SR411]|uniref:hypothetical protein n=1 Tax=Pseudanabaena sp. SR411 TaxID=1980935 RepID=UPI000B9875F8|nr:hypothetical protein [Pseudanabaena sp. SR411]OYQ66121.1 hypothetical protein B9G53_05245 [Pseudanabaena sp. SR411]
MYKFWSPDKLLLMIGLFQFGLILMMFMILSMGNRKNKNKHKGKVNKNSLNTPEAVTDVADTSVNNEIALKPTLPDPINQPLPSPPEAITDPNQANPPEIDLTYKVDIAPELLTELLEISDNPAAIVDEAIRWWLRRRNVDSLDSGQRHRRYPVGISAPRSLQNQWND